MKMQDALKEHSDMIEKSITTADISETVSSTTLKPELDLVPFLVNVADRRTPIVDMLAGRAKKGLGASHNFNKLKNHTAAGENLRDAFYGDGDLPRAANPGFGSISVPFKSAGYSGSVTGLAQAQGKSFIDLYETNVNSTMQLLKHALEWNFYFGSTSTSSPNTSEVQFAGLDELIDQSVDANGVKLQGTDAKQVINAAANLIAMNGGMATHLLVDLASKANLNDTYFNASSNAARIDITQDRTNLTVGEIVNAIETQAGRVEILGDFFLNPGNFYTLANGSASTPSGATTATAYLVDMNAINFVYIGDSFMTLEPLGKRTDKNEFFIKSYSVLELLASEHCVKIENISTSLT